MTDQVLQNLNDIKSVTDSELSEVFCNNLQLIYQYAGKDITDAIENRDLTVLGELCAHLFEKLQESFPELQHKTLVTRRVKHTQLNDIFQIGYSIVNKSVSKDLEKAFVPSATNNASASSDDDSGTVQDLSQLIGTVSSLMIRIGTLEKDIVALQKSNRDFEKLVAELQGMRAVQPANPGPSTTNSEASDRDSSQTNNAGSQQSDQVTGPSSANSPGSSVDPPPKTSTSGTSDSSPSSTEDEEGFVEYQSKKKHKKRKRKTQKQGKHLPTATTTLRAATSAVPAQSQTSLKAATSTGQQSTSTNKSATKPLYLGNVHPSSTIQDIRNHLAKYGVHVSAEDVRPLAKGVKSCSYRAEIPEANFSSLISDSSVWPEGLKVREFFPAPQHKRRSGSNARPHHRNSRFNLSKHNPRFHHGDRHDNRYDRPDPIFRHSGRKPRSNDSSPRHYPVQYDNYAQAARCNSVSYERQASGTGMHSDAYDEYASDYDSWYPDYTYESGYHRRH